MIGVLCEINSEGYDYFPETPDRPKNPNQWAVLDTTASTECRDFAMHLLKSGFTAGKMREEFAGLLNRQPNSPPVPKQLCGTWGTRINDFREKRKAAEN
jgi:hypothetical protein